MSKIATIEKLISVEKHPDADKLDIVKVLGYQCVCAKGLHKTGDVIIYIQPDSVLPEDATWAEEYRKYSPKRIKAVKLRGEWSEGIIVRFEQVQEILDEKLILVDENLRESKDLTKGVGADVSIALGITHYEPPIPQDLSAKGLLPFGMPKTDEERFENIYDRLPFGEIVDITLKIDGQSCSIYYDVETDQFGVAGRTLEFKEDATNKYTAHVDRYDIKNKLTEYCKKHNVSLCLRGESYGSGIQTSENNPHSKNNSGLAIFSVYKIREREYARLGDRFYFKNVCEELNLPMVPMLESQVYLTQEIINKYAVDLKKLPDTGNPFEGVVVNHYGYTVLNIKEVEMPDGSIKKVDQQKYFNPGSFKIINKNYDMNK